MRSAKAVETPIGNLPAPGTLDSHGLSDVTPEDLAQLTRVEVDGWLQEAPLIAQYYDQFGSRMPAALREELRLLKEGLEAARR